MRPRPFRVLFIAWLMGGLCVLIATPPSISAALPQDSTPAQVAPPDDPPKRDAAYKSETGPCAVEEFRETWHDEARGRDVPVRFFVPQTRGGPLPLVVFSHGLGGSRDGYGDLGRHWAGHGYVVIHPTHVGSDTSIAKFDRGRPSLQMMKVAEDPIHWRDRPLDVIFVIDQALAHSRLGQRIDPLRIGVAGHSFGAHTALQTVGLQIDMPRTRNAPAQRRASFADPRVRAAIAMSPQGQGALGLDRQSWSQIRNPVMCLAGTADVGPGARTARSRLEAHRRIPGRDQFQVVIEGGEHFTFTDEATQRLFGRTPNDDHRAWIRMTTTAFLDAYLRDDDDAQQWLLDGAIGKLSARKCRLVHKNVTPVQIPAP